MKTNKKQEGQRVCESGGGEEAQEDSGEAGKKDE